MTRVEELRSLVEPHMSSGHLGILDQLTHVLITGSAQASGGRAAPAATGARYWGPATGIDWCEEDYAVSPFIAEFFNTLSNAAYVVAGLSCLRQARAHACLRADRRFAAAAVAIILTGAASAWFHATLHQHAQRADEAVENAAVVLLAGTASAGAGASASAGALPRALLHCAAAAAGVCFVTAFLFCEVHLIAMVLVLLRRLRGLAAADKRVRPHILRAAVLGAAGFGCWLVDRVGCGAVLAATRRWGLPNPQLHAWWHLLTGAALHEAFYVSAVGALVRATRAQHGALPLHRTCCGLLAAVPLQPPVPATAVPVRGAALYAYNYEEEDPKAK